MNTDNNFYSVYFILVSCLSINKVIFSCLTLIKSDLFDSVPSEVHCLILHSNVRMMDDFGARQLVCSGQQSLGYSTPFWAVRMQGDNNQVKWPG